MLYSVSRTHSESQSMQNHVLIRNLSHLYTERTSAYTWCIGLVENKLPTLFMYSESRSWRAWRMALHSAIIRSRWKSLVHEESANSAAPLIMASRRFSSDGLISSSVTVSGSKTIKF